MRLALLAAALVLSLASVARGDDFLPITERTPETARWLAVAFVAEAGWGAGKRKKAKMARADHQAIFHVLKNRYPHLRKQYPRVYTSFLRVVQNYVAALDPRTPKGARVRWLRALTGYAKNDFRRPPAGWPAKYDWGERYSYYWLAVYQRALDCLYGQCGDPYYGGALHWGGAMDAPKGCMYELPNMGTHNTFYGIDMDCRRRRARK